VLAGPFEHGYAAARVRSRSLLMLSSVKQIDRPRKGEAAGDDEEGDAVA
jgi:hypothetical protein